MENQNRENQADAEVVDTSPETGGDRPEGPTSGNPGDDKLLAYAKALLERPTAGVEVEVNLSEEPVEVQAAYLLLGDKGITSWAGYTVATYEGRLKAARWYGRIWRELNATLTGMPH